MNTHFIDNLTSMFENALLEGDVKQPKTTVQLAHKSADSSTTEERVVEYLTRFGNYNEQMDSWLGATNRKRYGH